MDKNLNNSINKMISSIKNILLDNIQSIYIYGSCAANDFKLGWSDIDILVLTKSPIDSDISEKLLYLRQNLLKEEPTNMYYRSFEGAILSSNSFFNNTNDNVVYWGTKGEKKKDTYKLDSFSKKELIEKGILLYGDDIRNLLKTPTFDELKQDILRHYQTIREHAKVTGRNFYSFGWFLDISRCLYTLKTGSIISKTEAGEWALKNKLCPCIDTMKNILKIRYNPLEYKNETTLDYAQTLGPKIQEYADVLEQELNRTTNHNISK